MNWIQISTKSLLKAMKYENEEARKLLPAILLELTNEEADIQTTFINEVMIILLFLYNASCTQPHITVAQSSYMLYY